MPATREFWADGPGVLTSMLRHWLLIAVTAVVMGAAAYMAVAARDPVYEASAELMFSGFQVEAVELDEPERRNPERWLQHRTSHIRASAVMERASELLEGRVDPETLRGSITVWSAPEMLDSVWISGRAGTADDAADFANAVGEAYQQVTADQRREDARTAIEELDGAIGRMEERITELDAADDPDAVQPTAAAWQRRVVLTQLHQLSWRRERLEVMAETADAGVAGFQPAQPPDVPVAPRPRPAGAAGAFVGLALASAYAYRQEGRGLARTADDVRAQVDVAFLGEVPRSRDRRRSSPGAPGALLDRVAPSYQFLAVVLEGLLGEQSVQSIAIAGVQPRRGHAAVAMHAALALCQEGRRVVLVDADLRERRLTRTWHLTDSLGLADLHDPRVSFQRVSTLAGVVGGDATWAFVPAGTRQPAPARLRPSTVQRLLREVTTGRKDGQSVRVVLHAPPVLEVADVSTIARLVDGVVLEVSARTRVEDIRHAVEMIDVAGGRVVGVVFVGGRRVGRRRSLPSIGYKAAVRPRSASVS